MNLITVLGAIAISCTCAIAQETEITKSKTPVESNQQTAETNQLSQEKKDKILREISQIDSHLNSIAIKAEYISNNPDEMAIAEETGWFEDMKVIKEKLNSKKAELQKLLE